MRKQRDSITEDIDEMRGRVQGEADQIDHCIRAERANLSAERSIFFGRCAIYYNVSDRSPLARILVGITHRA